MRYEISLLIEILSSDYSSKAEDFQLRLSRYELHSEDKK